MTEKYSGNSFKGVPFIVVSCPGDPEHPEGVVLYHPGALFKRQNFSCTLAEGSWPDGLVVRDTRDNRYYRVEGTRAVALDGTGRLEVKKKGGGGMQLVRIEDGNEIKAMTQAIQEKE